MLMHAIHVFVVAGGGDHRFQLWHRPGDRARSVPTRCPGGYGVQGPDKDARCNNIHQEHCFYRRSCKKMCYLFYIH